MSRTNILVPDSHFIFNIKLQDFLLKIGTDQFPDFLGPRWRLQQSKRIKSRRVIESLNFRASKMIRDISAGDALGRVQDWRRKNSILVAIIERSSAYRSIAERNSLVIIPASSYREPWAWRTIVTLTIFLPTKWNKRKGSSSPAQWINTTTLYTAVASSMLL